jgi:hypothetical protein
MLAIEERELRSYDGGWAEPLRRRGEQELLDGQAPERAAKRRPEPARAARRERQSERASELERLEAGIARQEQAVADLEQRLAENWTDTELVAAHRRERERLSELLARWESLFEQAAP